MARTGIYLEIDASDLKDTINRLRISMSEEKFQSAMYGIFRRTGGHVKRILREDLPSEYHVKPGAVGAAVGGPKVTTSGLGVGCVIPIKAPRGGIGGGGADGGFGAYGGARGWNSRRRKYKIRARIVTSGMSELPANAPESGFPPFRNIGSVLGGKAYARRSKARGPLVRMKGIAIPQMPMNRSEGDVQRDIKDYLQRQMEQRLMYLLRSGK